MRARRRHPSAQAAAPSRRSRKIARCRTTGASLQSCPGTVSACSRPSCRARRGRSGWPLCPGRRAAGRH
eukprot:2399133-Prymnesium_polylepis.1